MNLVTGILLFAAGTTGLFMYASSQASDNAAWTAEKLQHSSISIEALAKANEPVYAEPQAPIAIAAPKVAPKPDLAAKKADHDRRKAIGYSEAEIAAGYNGIPAAFNASESYVAPLPELAMAPQLAVTPLPSLQVNRPAPQAPAFAPTFVDTTNYGNGVASSTAYDTNGHMVTCTSFAVGNGTQTSCY